MFHAVIATLFPQMCESVINESIIGRAIKKGAVNIECMNIRDYTLDKHRRVDDEPYGGGRGMVMQADPIFRCYEAALEKFSSKPYVIYMSPKGRVFDQKKAIELAKRENIFIICGHYEGVDERIIEEIVDEEISIGDYVLTGGELAALCIADAVSRMCEGVLADKVCFEEESHFAGLLEYPQYTRPNIWHERKVPEVLLSGDHKKVDDWRHEKSVEITKQRRPDMLKSKNN